MLYNEYLKNCRQKYTFTQEELVQELYLFSSVFEGLDVSTLGRWERGVTKPNVDKQIQILRFFQTKSNFILSCFESLDKASIEDKICKVAVQNLLGSSKDHILNGPTSYFKLRFASVKSIRLVDDIDKALAMPYSTILNLTDNAHNLSLEKIKSWALHPSSFFLYAEYHEQFSGMLFSLRLKPKIFQKLIDFEKKLEDVTVDDFASFEEVGSHFLLSFFAHNEKISSLLITRLYAHFIANQQVIQNVGDIPILDSGKKMQKNMHLEHYKKHETNDGILDSYYASLDRVLINETVLKMIFRKQKCPEDDF